VALFRVGYKSGVRFDTAHYMAKHLAIAASVMGPHGLKSVEVMKVTSTLDGLPPPYQVIVTAYFETAAGMQNALQSSRMAEVVNDVPNYYDGKPDVMTGEVMALPR